MLHFITGYKKFCWNQLIEVHQYNEQTCPFEGETSGGTNIFQMTTH